jgi:hypothetical protein
VEIKAVNIEPSDHREYDKVRITIDLEPEEVEFLHMLVRANMRIPKALAKVKNVGLDGKYAEIAYVMDEVNEKLWGVWKNAPPMSRRIAIPKEDKYGSTNV